jgi:hypothetical protein
MGGSARVLDVLAANGVWLVWVWRMLALLRLATTLGPFRQFNLVHPHG